MDVCRQWLICTQAYFDTETNMERLVSTAKVMSEMIAIALDRIGREAYDSSDGPCAEDEEVSA